MNDQNRPQSQYQALYRLLALAVALMAVSISCSVGQLLVGQSEAVLPTPTKTPRPTFTPLPAVLTPRATVGPLVRGALPPGVTPVAPAPGFGTPAAIRPEQEEPVGSTSLILYATDTPVPTPTPVPTEVTPSPTPEGGTGPQATPTPYVIVNADTINGRRGPATTFPRIGEAKRGEELIILARTPDGNWWQVCCMANQPVWVAAELVIAQGALETVPVVTPPPTPVPPPPPAPTPIPPPTLTPMPPFDIAQGPQFPFQRDNGVLTIWVKVYEGPLDNQKPLAGYILKVFRDGVDVSDNAQSFGNAPFYNSFPEGNFEYNLKFERFNAGEADWEIYLARPGGFRVSPVTQFTTKGDSYRNLVVYIAYWLAR